MKNTFNNKNNNFYFNFIIKIYINIKIIYLYNNNFYLNFIFKIFINIIIIYLYHSIFLILNFI